MRDPQRIKTLAQAYGLPNQLPLSPISRNPSNPAHLLQQKDFDGNSFHATARKRLEQLRITRINASKSSSRLSLPFSKNDQLSEKKKDSWRYTRKERGDILESVFEKREAVGLGQALIEFIPNDPLNVNIREHDDNLGKKDPRRESLQVLSNGSSPESGWLERAAARGEKSWVELFASRGATSLNSALGAAIRSGLPQSLGVIDILLKYGANPNSQADAFKDAVQYNNQALMNLLMSSNIPLSVEVLTDGLLLAVQIKSLPTVALLLSRGADLNQVFEETVIPAIQTQDRLMVCNLLLNSKGEFIEPGKLQKAIQEACGISQEGVKLEMLDLLLSYGAPVDDPIFHKEIQYAVQNNKRILLNMLMSHGVLPNTEDSESLRLAIVQQKYDLLQVLLQKPMTGRSVSNAMDMIPPTASEDNAILVLEILAKKGYEEGCCGRLLLRAVQNQEMKLMRMILSMKPSLSYDEAHVVRLALERNDLRLLDLLIKNGLCSPQKLSKSIPEVFRPALGPARRRQALIMLIDKGVSSPEIDEALQKVCMPDARDMELVSRLLSAGASVNHQTGNLNSLKTAAENGDLECLTILCQAKPSPSEETLSAALPGAVAARSKISAEAFIAMIDLLFQTGPISAQVYGQVLSNVLENPGVDMLSCEMLLKNGHLHATALDEILIQEAGGKCRKDVLATLLKYGANVNHNDGMSLNQAIGKSSLAGVQVLLERKPNQPALAQAFSTARTAPYSAQYRADVLQAILMVPYQQAPVNDVLCEATLAGEVKIVNLMMDHGASADYDSGKPLALAVQKGSQAVVDALLARNPHPQTVRAAFNQARLSSMTDQQRTRIYSSLLRHNIPDQYTSAALVSLVTHGSKSTDLYQLLLSHGASLDFDEGKALCLLVDRGDVPTTNFLLGTGSPNIHTLDFAFNRVMNTRPFDKRIRLELAKLLLPVSKMVMTRYLPQAVQDGDNELLQLLIKRGADPGLNRDSIKAAATAGDAKSLKTLLEYVEEDDYVVNETFSLVREEGIVQKSPLGIKIAEILLQKGVARDIQGQALLDGFTYAVKRNEFVSLILQYDPDVNVVAGQCFMHASNMQDLAIFDKMLEKQPNLNIIIPALIASDLEERRLMDCLARCFSSEESLEDLSSKLIFEAVDKHPNSDDLMKLLVQRGCSAGQTEERKLSETTEKESVTPLIWALSRQKSGSQRPGVKDSVILALLDAGSDVEPDFMTEQTRLSALHLAIQQGRKEITQKLLFALKAEVDIVDAHKKSPLFYAASQGELETVQDLISADASVDDGSLHEAAREMHGLVMQELINAGHNIKAPSPHHGGRSPLAELCLNSRQWSPKARKLIHFLTAKTPVEQKYRDPKSNEWKNVVHFAIDNEAGFEILNCLVSQQAIYDRINSDDFLFETASSICYSPISYVEHFYKGTTNGQMKQQMIDLFKGYNCQERYFARRGPQPTGSVGLPGDLIEQHRRDLMLDQAHEAEMRRVRERSSVQIDLFNRQEANARAQAENLHRQRIGHEREIEAQRIQERTNLLDYNQDLANQTLRITNSQHNEQARLADSNRNAEFAQAQRIANLRTRTLQDQANIQTRLLERGDESVSRRGEEMRRTMAQARTTGVTMPSMPNLLLEGPD